ncbi:MAG: 4-hydroxybenzoate octaprenyltransferase [Leptospirillia bacterium]
MDSSLKATPPARAHGFRDTGDALLDLMRVRNPVGTFLLLLPSLWALVLAGGGRPPLHLVAVFVMGAFLMRSAGCIINDIADRRIDPQVERTRNRPLASGRLSVPVALFAFAVLVGLAFVLVLQLNRLTLLLSACGLGLAVLYPFTKRFVSIPQAFLGIAFGWGAFMAWAAVRNEIALTPALLFAATICWAIAYDTIYAIQDIDDDRKVGVKSSAILFGDRAWTFIVAFLAATVTLLAAAGAMQGLGLVYFSVLSGCMVYFVRQGVRVRQGLTRPEAFALFAAHVPAGTIILFGMWADFLLTGVA